MAEKIVLSAEERKAMLKAAKEAPHSFGPFSNEDDHRRDGCWVCGIRNLNEALEAAEAHAEKAEKEVNEAHALADVYKAPTHDHNKYQYESHRRLGWVILRVEGENVDLRDEVERLKRAVEQMRAHIPVARVSNMHTLANALEEALSSPVPATKEGSE